MSRQLSILAALVGLIATPALSQNQAKGALYTRVEGDRVSAAVVLRINPDWYLYHTDLGSPDVIGTPATFEFGGEGITWGEFQLQAPKVGEVDDEILGQYTYNYHVGKIVGYAVGTLVAGAQVPEVTLSLTGLTCSNVTGTCVPYDEELASKGAGKDKYWEDWPEEFGALPAAAPAVQDSTAAIRPSITSPSISSPSITKPPLTSPSFSPGGGGGPQELVRGTLWVRVEGDQARAVIELEIEEGFHVYHGPSDSDLGHEDTIAVPTTASLEYGDIEWGRVEFPAPEDYDQGQGVIANVHHGTLRLLFRGLAGEEPDPADVLARVAGQVCDDSSCIPFELELEPAAGNGPEAAFAGFDAPVAATLQASGNANPVPPLWEFLLWAVFWGVITLLMPCTYPMIPITISFFTKQAIARDGKVLPLSLTYGAGIVLIFILIGLVAAPVIIPFATHPVTNIVIGGLFLLFALVLFGMINLQPPQFLNKIAGQASARGGFGGVFLMGATLVVTSFTCTAPFVGALLGQAARSGSGGMVLQDFIRVVLGMGVFGLTMATPFVLLSLLPGRMQKIPQAGEWMNTLKVFLGFVELAAALKFLSNADVVWGWGIISREVFLIAWVAIFVGAGIYLFVRATRSTDAAGERQVNRKLVSGGVLSMAFALYCAWGVPGNDMDEFVMTAMLPPYSHAPVVEFFGGTVAEDAHVVVLDDYPRALEVARTQDKLLLVNFTGFS